MRSIYAAVVGTLFLASTLSIYAQPSTTTFQSAASLSEDCKKNTFPFDMLCVEYIMGVHDSITVMRAIGLLRPTEMAYCLPEAAKPANMIEAVRIYLLAKPPSPGSQVMAPVIVVSALQRAFPCK